MGITAAHCRVVAAALAAVQLLAVQGAAVTSAPAVTGSNRPVHLVHVLAAGCVVRISDRPDDLGYNDVSWHNPVMKTPALQKLVDGGVHLSNFHTWKACAPSRGAIMSGRYPFHYGFYKNQDANAYGLATNFSTIPEMLAAHGGYSCHMAGKWHLGYRSEELTPTRRGFETWVGYYWHGEDYYTHVRDDNCGPPGIDFSNASTGDEGAIVWPLGGDNGTYSAFIFTREAQRVIRMHASKYRSSSSSDDRNDTPVVTKPLYLYVPMQNVHAPIEVPLRFEALYDGIIADPHRKTFAGMVSALDEAVANITHTLEEEGLWQDTLFLFNSDNGGPLGSANNYPLRGGKFTYWDGGVRIQAFLYSPRRDIIPASMVGAQWTGLAHTVDVMPTLFAAAGLDFDRYSTYSGDDATIRANFDGLNLLHAIQTNASSPRSEVVHMINNEYNHAICDETTGVGGQNHCGAAITTSDGFKLLLGYPGTDIWERPPSNEEAHAVCDPEAFMQNTCLHVFKDQLSNFSSSDATKCCGACSANPRCGSWTLKGGVCYLKTVGAADSNKDQHGCTSGIVRGQPANACNQTNGIGCPCNPPSRGCLFYLPTDPNEHKDLSNDPAFASDFERLSKRLADFSKTGVVATEEMLGKVQGAADSIAACKLVNMTGFYESFAPHVPFSNHPAPDDGSPSSKSR